MGIPWTSPFKFSSVNCIANFEVLVIFWGFPTLAWRLQSILGHPRFSHKGVRILAYTVQ